MMQCEYDPERLIEEVKKRPGIWDYDDPAYRSYETRQKLWQEVVKELITGIQCSKSEMRELQIQLQKKWKGMRDAFQKYVNKPNWTKKPYVYSKQLQFLMKSLRSRGYSKPEEPESGSDDDGGLKSKWKRKAKLKLVKDEESSEDDNGGDEVPVYYEYNEDNAPTPAKVAKPSRATEEFAFANVDSNSDDCDRMFLLSLLPHLKAIPEAHRMDAKIELMQTLRNKARSSSSNNLI